MRCSAHMSCHDVTYKLYAIMSMISNIWVSCSKWRTGFFLGNISSANFTSISVNHLLKYDLQKVYVDNCLAKGVISKWMNHFAMGRVSNANPKSNGHKSTCFQVCQQIYMHIIF